MLFLVPVVGERVLGLSAFLIGVLMVAQGLGSLIGSLAVGSLARPAQYLRLYVGGAALFLLMVLIFALSTSFVLSLVPPVAQPASSTSSRQAIPSSSGLGAG